MTPPQKSAEEIASECVWIKPGFNCIAHFPIDIEKNVIKILLSERAHYEGEIEKWKHNHPGTCPNDAQIAELKVSKEQLEAEVENLNALLKDRELVMLTLDAANQELRTALLKLRDAVKSEPVMNNMKYDALGIEVNMALSNPPASYSRKVMAVRDSAQKLIDEMGGRNEHSMAEAGRIGVAYVSLKQALDDLQNGGGA